MIFTLLATIIIAGTCLLALGQLRGLARDGFEMLTAATTRSRSAGALLQRTAFVSLWVMIFGLSLF